MMRAPAFRYHAARSVKDAVAALSGEPDAMALAGGTDLVPNMKRRTQTPSLVVGLRGVAALRRIRHGDGLTLGAGLTLTEIAESRRLGPYAALTRAAGSVATVHLRNMGTLGGNLCLDTRCNYYNQNAEWRSAIDHCMKAPKGTGGRACASPDGTGICWVATSSPRCWAVSSTDTAPALIALGAEVTLAGPDGERRLALDDLYANDGMAYLAKRREELLTAVHLAAPGGVVSTYWKLRRRGSFDFPVLGVAAAIGFRPDGTVASARVVLGAVASRPVLLDESRALVGTTLGDDAIAEVADAATRQARPMDNTDFELSWRKKVVRSYVTGALKELRDRRA